MYTNKVAVLAGDYLLARASVLLARLQHLQVVEVMASALDFLVQGEIMQARSKKEDLLDMNFYLRKSYMKTASLICNSCKSSALLLGYSEDDVITQVTLYRTHPFIYQFSTCESFTPYPLLAKTSRPRSSVTIWAWHIRSWTIFSTSQAPPLSWASPRRLTWSFTARICSRQIMPLTAEL